MSNIKLFQIKDNLISELISGSIQLEKSLQNLIEANSEKFLGVRCLATEYPKGQKCRLDTLGMDENGSPVIIEYKRNKDQNVITQGLYYLEWLLDHKKDFRELVRENLGEKALEDIDWDNPRILCIANDFSKFDINAVKMIDKNIDLIRYKKYDTDIIFLEWINTIPKSTNVMLAKEQIYIPSIEQKYDQSFTSQVEKAKLDIKDILDETKRYLLGLGDDVQIKEARLYLAFRRALKNFACVGVDANAKIIRVLTKLNPEKIVMKEGFTRDIRKESVWSLEIIIRSIEDLNNAKDIITKSYELESQ